MRSDISLAQPDRSDLAAPDSDIVWDRKLSRTGDKHIKGIL